MDMVPLPPGWQAALEPVLNDPRVVALQAFLEDARAAGDTIYPPDGAWLRALELTPPDTVKAVILGQDPYHGPGQAMGLAFSVPAGVRQPPTLANIFKELQSDCGVPRPAHGDLSAWARQGVLLLNTSLTVAAGRAGSHAGKGWEALTHAVLAAVAAKPEPSVIMLWGSHAQVVGTRIAPLMDGPHCVIRSAHPSPLSAYRGFFGSRPFSRANAFLERVGREPVDWRL